MNLNRNQYALNPFGDSEESANRFVSSQDDETGEEQPVLAEESDLTVSFGGFNIMNTKNIREKVLQEMGDVIEGVSGRWTFFTQLHKVD